MGALGEASPVILLRAVGVEDPGHQAIRPTLAQGVPGLTPSPEGETVSCGAGYSNHLPEGFIGLCAYHPEGAAALLRPPARQGDRGSVKREFPDGASEVGILGGGAGTQPAPRSAGAALRLLLLGKDV